MIILSFVQSLQLSPGIISVQHQLLAGVVFLFVQSTLTLDRTNHLMEQVAEQVTKNSDFRTELIFVRKGNDCFIYRLRFLVPLEKSFCCGNLCGEDCILLK
jgi:hypothetical protein